MRNSGSVIGGAINFATNYSSSSAGGISWSTYLIFVGFGELQGRVTDLDADEASSRGIRFHLCLSSEPY